MILYGCPGDSSEGSVCGGRAGRRDPDGAPDFGFRVWGLRLGPRV